MSEGSYPRGDANATSVRLVAGGRVGPHKLRPRTPVARRLRAFPRHGEIDLLRSWHIPDSPLPSLTSKVEETHPQIMPCDQAPRTASRSHALPRVQTRTADVS